MLNIRGAENYELNTGGTEHCMELKTAMLNIRKLKPAVLNTEGTGHWKKLKIAMLNIRGAETYSAEYWRSWTIKNPFIFISGAEGFVGFGPVKMKYRSIGSASDLIIYVT